jgi:KDO2-lipid IV(A) lauroyltransferase
MLKIRYLLEFTFIFLIASFFRLFPIEIASNIGGFLGRNIMFFICRFTGDNKKGIANLTIVFPDYSEEKKLEILKKSYENIGRFAAEYVNQHKMNAEYFAKNVKIINQKGFEDAMKNGCFGITAHFGNWEIMQRYSDIIDTDLNVIYNPLQNPHTNKLYLSQRKVKQIPKGSNSLKQLIEVIKAKKNVGVLIDQRDKAGEIFQFFGRDARTSTAIQRLALKYNYTIMSIKCMRRKDNPNKFILEVYPAIEIEKTDNFEADLKTLTNKTLELLEDWIKKDPENWLLWFYSRWRTKF